MFLACALFLGACGAPVSKAAARGLPPVTLVASANDEVTVGVLELICQSCAEHILAGCRRIEGVASVEADRRERLITVYFDSSVTTRERILAAVDDVVASIP
ncbi:MAG: heavy-metal-associated domain-containing protein [Chloroflexota bacterium]|nr:heavy-metal-associated domain-containing protein [Chloroflexota bacterium]